MGISNMQSKQALATKRFVSYTMHVNLLTGSKQFLVTKHTFTRSVQTLEFLRAFCNAKNSVSIKQLKLLVEKNIKTVNIQ